MHRLPFSCNETRKRLLHFKAPEEDKEEIEEVAVNLAASSQAVPHITVFA